MSNNGIYTDRFELKYLCQNQIAIKFLNDIKKIYTADTNSVISGYYNYSIYFDSPHFTFYREKKEGLENRIKPRLRTHLNKLNQEEKQWYFEIKERSDRVIYKNRELINEFDLNQALSGNIEILKKIKSNSKHYLTLLKNCIIPVVSTLYKREAYIDSINKNIRITFDTNITGSFFCTKNISTNRIFLIDPRYTLIEIKFHKTIPNNILSKLYLYNMKNINFSKYGKSVEMFLNR